MGVCRCELGEGPVGGPRGPGHRHLLEGAGWTEPALEARSPESESGSVTELLRDLRQVPLCLWTCYTACVSGKWGVGGKSACSMIYIWGSWARDEKGEEDFWLKGRCKQALGG